jgi:geranylgeranyl diphosphate synthase type II
LILCETSFLSKKELFEKELALSIEALCEKNTLRDACEYALMNGGKRFRPLIVQSIGEALCPGAHITKAALAIEYFHTASLIADDLPCMDNDSIRRNKPSLHVAFGETIALLASYALISEAYKKIHEAGLAIESQNLPFASLGAQICFKAFEVASSSSGLSGATLGQYYDLFPKTNSLTHL